MTGSCQGTDKPHVTIIGAGVVGICCACYLQRSGFKVTVIDRLDPGMAASYGNAGGLGIGEVAPVSMPGIAFKVPGWLMDPTGPLALRLAYLPKITPWLLKFLFAGTKKRVLEISKSLATLCHLAYRDFDLLLQDAGIENIVQKNGALYLYDTEAEFQAEKLKWDLRREHGIGFERINGEDLPSLEPDIASDFGCAMLMKDWYHLSNPYRLVTTLAEHFVHQGGKIIKDEVSRIECVDSKANRLSMRDGATVDIESLVIAAGAWSHQLTRQLGDRVPLESERGYHTTLPDPGVYPSRQILYASQNFVITPMEMGLRVAGTVELAGLDAPPNYERARVLLPKAKRVYPALQTHDGMEWMGHRPALPDSLPIIAQSPRALNVYYAFGHGHLGLTFGPTTGRLITELIAGKTPEIDMKPYRVDRF
ncbi:MAG: FAD-binding oxidoreductase [Gammaproteobacteria bacterium]|nr:FAD-binding oxidoreductase [Gammaproteobacteria bacterium]